MSELTEIIRQTVVPFVHDASRLKRDMVTVQCYERKAGFRIHRHATANTYIIERYMVLPDEISANRILSAHPRLTKLASPFHETDILLVDSSPSTRLHLDKRGIVHFIDSLFSHKKVVTRSIGMRRGAGRSDYCAVDEALGGGSDALHWDPTTDMEVSTGRFEVALGEYGKPAKHHQKFEGHNAKIKRRMLLDFINLLEHTVA
jgi:hypothetical protein